MAVRFNEAEVLNIQRVCRDEHRVLKKYTTFALDELAARSHPQCEFPSVLVLRAFFEVLHAACSVAFENKPPTPAAGVLNGFLVFLARRLTGFNLDLAFKDLAKTSWKGESRSVEVTMGFGAPFDVEEWQVGILQHVVFSKTTNREGSYSIQCRQSGFQRVMLVEHR